MHTPNKVLHVLMQPCSPCSRSWNMCAHALRAARASSHVRDAAALDVVQCAFRQRSAAGHALPAAVAKLGAIKCDTGGGPPDALK